MEEKGTRMIYNAWCIYLMTVAASFSVSLGIGLYEEWLVRRRGERCLYTRTEWKENLLQITTIALVPIMNVFSMLFAVGYFCVEHLPYIVADLRGNPK